MPLFLLPSMEIGLPQPFHFSEWEGIGTASSILVGSEEILTADAGLPADRAEGRAVDAWMIGHGERRASAIGVLAQHRYVFPLTHHFKAQRSQRRHHFGFRSVNGKLGHGRRSKRGFGNESIQRRAFGLILQ